MRIGVDLGATSIKLGIVDFQGNILKESSSPTRVELGADTIIQDIINEIGTIVEKQRISMEEIEAIGIGVPGLVEEETGRLIYGTNLLWRDVDLRKAIRDYFKKPVYIANDGVAAALGEKIAGSTKGINDSVFITLGTGVGGGFIINGEIYTGSHGWGSEIGHMVVGENFYNCNCGQNGCWETFVSATAIIKYTQKTIREGWTNSLIMKSSKDDLDNIDGKIIFNAAKEGDILALHVVDRFIRYLAIGIVNIYNILDPGCIAIGGGLSKAGDFIFQPLKKEVDKRLFTKKVEYGDIVLAQLGSDAGIIGAAFLQKAL